jgi:hypothetical protein
MSQREIIGSGFLGFVIGLANAGGLGGGFLFFLLVQS